MIRDIDDTSEDEDVGGPHISDISDDEYAVPGVRNDDIHDTDEDVVLGDVVIEDIDSE